MRVADELMATSSGRWSRRLRTCVALVLAGILTAPLAHAEPHAAVVALVGEEGSAVLRRARAELTALGWKVVVLPALRGETVQQTARRAGAVAALRVSGPSMMELCVLPPDAASPDFTEQVTAEGEGASDVVAVRAVEALRGRLVEIGIPGPDGPVPRRASAAQPERVLQKSPSTDGRSRAALLRVGMGAAGSFAPGGAGPSAHGVGSLRFVPGRVSVSAFGLLPLVPASVTAAEGRASLSPLIAGGVIDAALFQTPTAALRVGAGAALVRLTMSGEAEEPFSGQQDAVVSGAPLARFAAAVALGSHVSLEAQTLAAPAFPRPSVHFGGRPVATWGRPLLVTALVLELALPGAYRASP